MSGHAAAPPVPVLLPPNQPADRFYAGGAGLAAFRGVPAAGTHVPEDWVASTTPLFGEHERGLARLLDGRLLRDALDADAVGWFGPAHVDAYGSAPEVLVKLLDAGERLPVHVHPDVPFALRHLACPHGKTEAWVALAPARVHLGFVRDVPADELARWVREQDADAMLAAMHALDLAAGDAVLVPAGLPHAIGAGALVVELQEPTDLSVLLEWDGFGVDGAADGHLGLGHGLALGAVDRRGWSDADVEALRTARADDVGPLLPGAERWFRVERHRGPARWDAGYAVLVVVAGAGTLTAADGTTTPLVAGQTWLVPHAAGVCRVAGADLEVLRCRPPLP